MVIISLVLIIGCRGVVNKDKALQLSSYLNSLEFAEDRELEAMTMEFEQLRNQFENMGLPDDSTIALLKKRLEASVEFSRFVREWKNVIIENSGGYSPYEELPEGWYKTIDSNEYRPSSDQDSIKIISDNVLMALIELTNKSISFSSKLNKLNHALIEEKGEPTQSVLFLAKIVQEPHQTIEGPLFYSFDYYPIDSLQINGKWYFGNEYVEIPREEWNEITKNDLKINLPLKLYWGDTAFQFTQKKH